jgi:collagenase-like PrtC family protease
MLILSPADRAAEVPELVSAGAEELYAGYVPPFWSEAFGPVVSCNRRTYEEANVPSLEELDAFLLASAVRDVPVYLALNASPIPEEMIPPLVDLTTDLARRGVRGVIVSDLSLLLALRDARFRHLELHASTLFSAFNAATAAFLKRAGARRVILSRELSTQEIAAMVTMLPDTALEVIGEKEWKGKATPEVVEAIERDEGTDRYYSCGLCAIPILERAGVHSFKLVGRGAETGRKVEAVAAACRLRAWGREAIPDLKECARRGKEMYEELFGRRCRPENCYFPEFRPGEDE